LWGSGSRPRSSCWRCAGTSATASPTRDLEELLAERGVEVDHVSVYRWVIRFTPLLIDAARPCRHGVGDRWHVDETYVKVAGERRYVYRAVDQQGQVIDVFVSPSRDIPAARRFFAKAIAATGTEPAEVVTDKASTYPAVLDEFLPGAFHNTAKHANNAIENDHGRLKSRLRPMRGLKQDRSARIIIAGHALIQNLRRGHYELGVDTPSQLRLPSMNSPWRSDGRPTNHDQDPDRPAIEQCNSA
jgi:IS6 family transposase